MVKSGKHLGVVRGWMQRAAKNGDMVTWGSREELHFTRLMCPAEMEQLAQDIRDASVRELVENLGSIRRVLGRLEETGEPFDLLLAQRDLDRLIEEYSDED